MTDRELIEEIRQNARDVCPRSLVLNQHELSVLFDALEHSERERERQERQNEEYITKLERQNARLALQLDTANRALDKALKEAP